MPDHRLPENNDELRVWITQAWEDGWRARASLTGRAYEVLEAGRAARLFEFLRRWDLAPPPGDAE